MAGILILASPSAAADDGFGSFTTPWRDAGMAGCKLSAIRILRNFGNCGAVSQLRGICTFSWLCNIRGAEERTFLLLLLLLPLLLVYVATAYPTTVTPSLPCARAAPAPPLRRFCYRFTEPPFTSHLLTRSPSLLASVHLLHLPSRCHPTVPFLFCLCPC